MVMIALLIILTGCGAAKNMKSGTISPKDAQSLLKEDGVILLDVRTPEEYQEKHIPGSILVPDYELKDKITAQVPDTKTKIVVYCRSGRRSAASAKVLAELGYENVYDLGGIIDWPYETESGK